MVGGHRVVRDGLRCGPVHQIVLIVEIIGCRGGRLLGGAGGRRRRRLEAQGAAQDGSQEKEPLHGVSYCEYTKASGE